MVLHDLFSLWNMCAYIICPFNRPAYFLLQMHIFKTRAGLLFFTDSFDDADGANHEALGFLSWMDYLVVNQPKEMNSKRCDLSNSQKHHDFSRKSYFCWWSFQKKIFIYLKSQFSHANVLPDIIERVQLQNCLIFFHHWHFNILLFLSNLLFSSTRLMQINKHWIQTKFLKLLT